MLPFRLSDLVNVAVDGRRAEDVRRAASWAEDGRRSNRVLIALRACVCGCCPLARRPRGRPGPSRSGPPPSPATAAVSGRAGPGLGRGLGSMPGRDGAGVPREAGFEAPRVTPSPGSPGPPAGDVPDIVQPRRSSGRQSAAAGGGGVAPGLRAPTHPFGRAAAPPRARRGTGASGHLLLAAGGGEPFRLSSRKDWALFQAFLVAFCCLRPATTGRGASKRWTAAANERVCSTRRPPPTGFTFAPPRARPRRTS